MAYEGALPVSRRMLKVMRRTEVAFMRRELGQLDLTVRLLRTWEPRFYESSTDFFGAKLNLVKVLESRDHPGDAEEAIAIAGALEKMLEARPYFLATAQLREMSAVLHERRYDAGAGPRFLDEAVRLASACLATDAYDERVRLLTRLLVKRYESRHLQEDHDRAAELCDTHPELCADLRERLAAAAPTER